MVDRLYVFDKHRYNFYTNRCIVCDKKLEKQSDEKKKNIAKIKKLVDEDVCRKNSQIKKQSKHVDFDCFRFLLAHWLFTFTRHIQ